MTAGQRNCYLAIGECLQQYGLEPVLFALHALLTEDQPEDQERALKLAAMLQDVKRTAEPDPLVETP